MKYRAVIIDDEAWTRELIRRIGHWREYGYQIVGEAADGTSGLECIIQLRPHLIITDMKMPGLDGSQLLRALEQNDIHAKVIVVSGYYDYEYARQALSSHVADYLLKPVGEDEFNKRLRACANELAEEDQKMLPAESILAEHIDPFWLKKYMAYREDLIRSFEACSEKGARIALEKLEELFDNLKDETIRLKMLIKENYDLQSLLEETLIAKYGDTREVLAGSDISFTIHENSTIHDLIQHYQRTVLRIIADVTARQQGRKKLDVTRICEFVDAHYTESITLEDTAARFNVSREYLCSVFKKETGVNFTEYLASTRMEKAKVMILEYGIPIQQVSEMVGYTDVAYFYRTFKKHFGNTPAKMREETDRSRADV